jgi:hypothetical protein
LAGLRLVQPLDNDFSLVEYSDARRFQCASSRSRRPVFKQEVCHSLTVDNPRSAAFDAYSGAAERVPHIGQRTGAVVEQNR